MASSNKTMIRSVVAVGMLAAALLIFYAFSNMGGPQGGPENKPQGPGTEFGPVAGMGARPEQPRPAGPSAVAAALEAGDAAALKAALAAHPRLDAPEGSGRHQGLTPLHIAATGSSSEIVTMLLNAGAPVDAKTAAGETPLMAAAAKGRSEVIALLCMEPYSASVDARNSAGRTALHFAAEGSGPGGLESVLALLNAGASYNVADDSGATPLALAAGSGDLESLRVLVSTRADPEAADTRGVTPLMRAAQTGDAEKVIELLNAGASVSTRAADGRTALDFARGRSDGQGRQVAEILAQAG
jgi:ankyrin repeat protein